MTKETKSRMTVTIDADVLNAIDKACGELIPRSTMTNHVLKKGLIAIRKERELAHSKEM